MQIERLDQLMWIDLAPPIVLAAAGDVLGEEFDDGDSVAAVAAAVKRLRSLALREAWAEFEACDPEPGGDWSARRMNVMAAMQDEQAADVCDLVNLALDRLRGEGRFPEHEKSEETMATKTAAKRTTRAKPKPQPKRQVTPDPCCRICGCTDGNGCEPSCEWVLDADGIETDLCTACDAKRRTPAAADLPDGLCLHCGTAIAAGVEACAVCGRRERVSQAMPLLPSSLGPLNGEVIPGGLAHRDASREIPIDRIDPSPYQRRRHFDESALEQLSASIVEVGLLQPIVVRPLGDRYELIAGERRLRATRLAGYREIAATVRDLDDVSAAQACAIENLDRENLNAIEEAETLRVLLNVGGLTQDELGQRLNRSQPWIANRMRLLELPDDWQDRIISREIPPTHARELLAWRHRPKVLAKAATWLKGDAAETLPSVDVFRNRLRQIACDCSKPLTGWQCNFKATKAQRLELDVETIDLPYGGKAEHAWNTKLWSQLNKEAKAKEQAAAKADSAKSAPAGKKKPDSPSEWSIRLRVTTWLAREVAARLRKTDRDTTLRLLMMLGTEVIESTATGNQCPHQLFARSWDDRKSAGVKIWRALIEMTSAQLAGVAHELVVAALRDQDEAVGEDAATTLVEILASLGGDPLAYPLSAEDLDLYDVALLRDMAGQQLDAKASKADVITCLLADRFPGWLPAEFAAILTPAKPKSTKRKAKPR